MRPASVYGTQRESRRGHADVKLTAAARRWYVAPSPAPPHFIPALSHQRPGGAPSSSSVDFASPHPKKRSDAPPSTTPEASAGPAVRRTCSSGMGRGPPTPTPPPPPAAGIRPLASLPCSTTLLRTFLQQRGWWYVATQPRVQFTVMRLCDSA
eukprot:364783-Chlamydomonas_euryale.AAC.15